MPRFLIKKNYFDFVSIIEVFLTMAELSLFSTSSVTVYRPMPPYTCKGFITVEYTPSPKFQCHFVGIPSERSTNWTDKGGTPVTGVAEKFATRGTGVGVGVDVAVFVGVGPLLFTIIYPGFVTDAVPPSEKVTVNETG